MDWIDQNLDAYRVIAEILTDLRPLVRERIEGKYGKEWFRDGIPEEVFERLIRNKEQEASIDWYENRYQEVISYAVFPDLFDIIIANADLFAPILKLAPSQSLLNTRFLELEVMRAKIGRARQVSEAEINFLTSFHLRFRRAVQELRDAPAADPAPAHASPPLNNDITDGGSGEPVDSADPATNEGLEEPPPEESSDKLEEPPPEESSDKYVSDDPTKITERPERPPQRLASPSAAGDTDQETAVEVDDPEESMDDPEEPAQAVEEASDDGEPKHRETSSATVKRAMESGDDQAVLREVYREVTGIAEVIWTTEEIPTTAIWDRVSTNQWYETSFPKLELRPLSDFYELISQVRAKRKNGASKAEVQSFLNDSKFATILLALRDMFQRNQI